MGAAPGGGGSSTAERVDDPAGAAGGRPDVLDAVLHAWLAALVPPAAVPTTLRAVAVDGKTCRGAAAPDGSRVHLFSIVEHGTGIPLGQVVAPSKGFEIAAFATVLDRLDLTDVVVTADALCRRRHKASQGSPLNRSRFGP